VDVPGRPGSTSRCIDAGLMSLRLGEAVPVLSFRSLTDKVAFVPSPRTFALSRLVGRLRIGCQGAQEILLPDDSTGWDFLTVLIWYPLSPIASCRNLTYPRPACHSEAALGPA